MSLLRACGASRRVALFGLGLLCAAAAAPARAVEGNAWAQDPVMVYYPRGDCRGDRIELEVFDRDTREWVPHPAHPFVPVESCQVEDAGRLLNELRWRCEEPPDTDPPSVFSVGLDVFDPRVMEQCSLGEAQGDSAVELHVESPAQGESVRNPTMEVEIAGSVRMNGLEGGEYDVVLVLDRSEATRRDGLDLFEAQLRAAQAFVEALRPRLGAVRIGILSYPNLPPLPGDGGTGGHREIALGDDPAALAAALDALRARGPSGFSTFLSAMAYGLRELDPAAGHGARVRARKVLVLAASAKGRLPFGPGADEDASFRVRLLAQAERARERGIALHLVGLAGLVEQTPKSVESALERSQGSLHRIPLPALETPFFGLVPLPEVREVVIANRTAGLSPRAAEVSPEGRFKLTLPAAPGENRLWLRASLSDGASGEREWRFRFDDSWVRERLLDAEAERIRRIRQEKRLRLDPEWKMKDEEEGAEP
jgi:hypothetical protein